MKKITILFIAIIFITISCEKNQAPQITSIASLTEIIVGGSEVILKIDVPHKKRDVLTFKWSANGGEFISPTSSDSAVWKAPISITEESYTITAEVSDGELKVEDELIIAVEGGKFIDLRDDNIYEFVKKSQQIWMAENLAYLPKVNGVDQSIDSPLYYVYGFREGHINEAIKSHNYLFYGALYNWKASLIACPKDWHLPSDEEWETLEIYLGMRFLDSTKTHRISGNVGKKLKSTTGWQYTGYLMDPDGNNSSGFNALPAGRADGIAESKLAFHDLKWSTSYWTSSTTQDNYYAWSRWLSNSSSGIFRGHDRKASGYSVRCIKDE